MEQLDNYLNQITELNKNKIVKNYKKYGYDDYNEMCLDLNLLLETKYQNIRLVSSKLKRDGQKKFREEILKRDKKCVISGEGELSCEAAHIKPFNNCKEEDKYDLNNGLLLGSSIHKLFDKYLWSINNNKVVVSNKILNNSAYYYINKYDNKIIHLNKKQKENMLSHYKIFSDNLKMTI